MTVAKGAVLRGVNQPFTIEELEWDDPGDDEVGVRVTTCGVCHSDYHTVNGNEPVEFPILTGHEGTGIVEKVGRNVTRIKEGDHVVMSWMPSCGHCPSCVSGQGQLCDRGAALLSGARDDGTFRIHDKNGADVWQFAFLGAFSEYVVIPEDGCIVVDNSLDLTKIPIVGCRIPTGWGAVVFTAQAKQGCTGLVVGLGGVGFNVIQGLKSVGAVVIIAADIVDKEKWAREFGATHYIDASKKDVVEEVMNITGIGVDYAFDAYGGSTDVQAACVHSTKKNGTAVLIGAGEMGPRLIKLDLWSLTMLQRTVKGTCYGGRSPNELVPLMIDMYKAGKIRFDELITKEYKLSEINEAYGDMLAGKNICGSIRMD
jgi:S-(hydroxymethyl)glutathione dehydrogenase/alcohol dehydrogenase